MQAVRLVRFGSPEVLELHEVPTPVPRRGEALVRIHASAVNPKDILLRRGKFGAALVRFLLPLPIGSDFAGVVERDNGSGLETGSDVWGMLGGIRFGACAEFVTVKRDEVARKPPTLSFAQAASLPLVSLTSLQTLRDHANLRPGQRVLIHGASGGVGTVAIQIAKALGGHVTASCSSRNHAHVRELGADVTIDYKTTPPESLDERFDVFFDVFGDKPFDVAKAVLSDRGRHITTVPSAQAFRLQVAARLRRDSQRTSTIFVRPHRSDLDQLAQMVARGSLRAVVDREYPLAKIADAHAYIETKRARGKVVLLS